MFIANPNDSILALTAFVAWQLDCDVPVDIEIKLGWTHIHRP